VLLQILNQQAAIKTTFNVIHSPTSVTASQALQLTEDRWFWQTVATAKAYSSTLHVSYPPI